MIPKFRISLTTILLVACVNSASAEQLSSSDCTAIGQTMEIYARQSLRIQEIRRDFTIARFESLLNEAASGGSQFSVEGQAIQNMLTALDETGVEVVDILPGIVAYRRLCPNG